MMSRTFRLTTEGVASMGYFNVGRWLAGGVVAGIVTFVMEGVASVFYRRRCRRL